MLQTGSQSTITAQFVTSGSLALSAHSKIIRANSLPLVLHRASNSTSTERLVGIMHHYETIFCHMRGFRSLSGQSSPLLYTNLKTFRPSFLPRLALCNKVTASQKTLNRPVIMQASRVHMLGACMHRSPICAKLPQQSTPVAPNLRSRHPSAKSAILFRVKVCCSILLRETAAMRYAGICTPASILIPS